jgi:hypothetical protein
MCYLELEYEMSLSSVMIAVEVLFLKIMKIVFDFISISLLLYPFQGNLIGS